MHQSWKRPFIVDLLEEFILGLLTIDSLSASPLFRHCWREHHASQILRVS